MRCSLYDDPYFPACFSRTLSLALRLKQQPPTTTATLHYRHSPSSLLLLPLLVHLNSDVAATTHASRRHHSFTVALELLQPASLCRFVDIAPPHRTALHCTAIAALLVSHPRMSTSSAVC